jgi:hypothetical protein
MKIAKKRVFSRFFRDFRKFGNVRKARKLPKYFRNSKNGYFRNSRKRKFRKKTSNAVPYSVPQNSYWLLTGGRCSDVICAQMVILGPQNSDHHWQVVVIRRWLLAQV